MENILVSDSLANVPSSLNFTLSMYTLPTVNLEKILDINLKCAKGIW